MLISGLRKPYPNDERTSCARRNRSDYSQRVVSFGHFEKVFKENMCEACGGSYGG